MSEKRLFVGLIVMVVMEPGVQHNHIEQFADWAENEDQARGAWTKKAFELHPGARMEKVWVTDITNVAAQGFPNG